jgi:hypothetical protein
VHDLFFRFGGGRPLHKVHFSIFWNLLTSQLLASRILLESFVGWSSSSQRW